MRKAQLLDGGSPKPKSVPTLKEEMRLRFLLSVAKLAKATIVPSTLLQPSGRPNTVLES